MTDARELADIEAIKQLKARYCRLLDTKQWGAWRELFTDDLHSDTTASGGKVVNGADAFVAFTHKSLRHQPTVHQVHAPEIELTSAQTARGTWALADVVRLAPGLHLHGHGHYDETYVKVDGQWRIRSSTLTRLRMDLGNGIATVHVSEPMRRTIARVARRLSR